MNDSSHIDLQGFKHRLAESGLHAADNESLARMYAALPLLSTLLRRVHQPLKLEDEPAHLPHFQVSSIGSRDEA